MTPKSIAEELEKNGHCVCPNFLSALSLRNTQDDFSRIQIEGGFSAAGTGQGSGHELRPSVRNDMVHWLNRAAPNRIQQALWRKLDRLKNAFNRTLYLGIRGFEGHYAFYPEGGFYKRHLDCFRKGGDRVISLVLYLNQDWQAVDGGRLRIYQGDAKDSHIDVSPYGGTMVCFMSQDSEHEVLLNHKGRASFTGWFKTEAIKKS